MALPFIAGAVGTAIIGKLVETCFSYLEVYPALRDVRVDLERLQCALLHVKTVLTAVEEARWIAEQNEPLVTWLWQLRDAVENAEDVLDELDYYELQKKTVRDRDDEVRSILSKYKEKFNRFVDCKFSKDTLKQEKFNRFVDCKFSKDTLKRLTEAVKGLDRVVAGIGPLVELVTRFYDPSVKRRKLEEMKNARETTSLFIESEVFGRVKERDQIVEWLIKPGDVDVDVSAFTIVGMGGLGKTTLARLVYSDERVREHFDSIMWVRVSLDFNVIVITKKILECVSKENFGDKSLHENLEHTLMSKRFLLVLDDVWNFDKMTEWERLVTLLKFGQRGSKILLTTRIGSVADTAAEAMKCKRESLNLNELKESDCLSLFNKHAFRGVNPDKYKNLQLIGEQIVKKLGGIPLAIKIMGGMLNSCMDYEYWKKILEKDSMELQLGNDDITTVLRLSYNHLPTNVQLCFSYCSLFPQDHVFKRRKLVNMWISSGLIPQSIYDRQRQPEDIGNEYLNLLTRKSFFTCKTYNYGFKITESYFVHDLLHDLAQSVSLGECIRVGGDVAGITIPQTVRHLSVEMVNLLSIREISNLKNVRTLVISVKEDNKHSADHALEFIEVIKGFKRLRLLILGVNIHSYKLMTDALSSLIHLRYISLSLGEVVNESNEYDGLTNLVNLRSLDVPDGVIQNIPYLSKLCFICELEDFFVREESGYKISELKNLRDLHRLYIRGLENVKSSEEAMAANLNEKAYLKSLLLGWSRDRSNCTKADEQLLDNLCPHINLKKMRIEQYQGAKSPCWMTNLSLVNLTSIELIDCKGWEHLPPLGQFSSLNRLYLRGLDAIKQIDCSFYRSSRARWAFLSLKQLFLLEMPNLEEWIGIDDGCMFPQLHYMEISQCPKLGGLPPLPPRLNKLHIFDVGLTALPAIQDYGNNNQEHFQALETLTIEQCEKLENIPKEFFGKFNVIKSLRMKKCPKLTKCGISDIQLPSILNYLTIGSCGDLEVPLLWSANLTSLTVLNLLDCARISSLPPAQVCSRWTMLSHLAIKNCKELSSLDGIRALVSLRSLEIRGCNNLIEAALLPRPPFPNDAGQKKNAEDCFLKLGELSIDDHALLLMEPLRSLSSISRLIFSDASRLTTLPEEWLLQNHTALKDLRIWNARSLPSLPCSMIKLCSLNILVLDDAKLIRSLPDLPTSLHTLSITGCHAMFIHQCQESLGPDWPKIARIRDVLIK